MADILKFMHCGCEYKFCSGNGTGFPEEIFGDGSDGDCTICYEDENRGNVFLEAKEYNFNNFTICENVKLKFCGQGVPVIRVKGCFVNMGELSLRNPLICTTPIFSDYKIGVTVKTCCNNLYSTAQSYYNTMTSNLTYECLSSTRACGGCLQGGGSSMGYCWKPGQGGYGGSLTLSATEGCKGTKNCVEGSPGGAAGTSSYSNAAGGGGGGSSYGTAGYAGCDAPADGVGGDGGVGGGAYHICCGTYDAGLGGGGGFGYCQGGKGGNGGCAYYGCCYTATMGGDGGNSYLGDGGNGGDGYYCSSVCANYCGIGGNTYYGNGGNGRNGGCSVYGNGGNGTGSSNVGRGGNSIYGNGGNGNGCGWSLYGDTGFNVPNSVGMNARGCGTGSCAWGGVYGFLLVVNDMDNQGCINGKGGDAYCGSSGAEMALVYKHITNEGNILFGKGWTCYGSPSNGFYKKIPA